MKKIFILLSFPLCAYSITQGGYQNIAITLMAAWLGLVYIIGQVNEEKCAENRKEIEDLYNLLDTTSKNVTKISEILSIATKAFVDKDLEKKDL
jgi:hypothetical protein